MDSHSTCVTPLRPCLRPGFVHEFLPSGTLLILGRDPPRPKQSRWDVSFGRPCGPLCQKLQTQTV